MYLYENLIRNFQLARKFNEKIDHIQIKYLCISLPLNTANNIVWPQHQGESNTIAHQDACQQDVAQLPARGSHHGGIVVSDEHPAYEHCDEDASGAQGHGSNSPPAVRTQVFLGDGNAGYVQYIWNCSLFASLALGWVSGVSYLKANIKLLRFTVNEKAIPIGY